MTEEIKVDDLPEDAVGQLDEAPVMDDDRLDRKTVSKIVERERQKAYEKAKREAMMEQQQAMQQQAPQAAPTQAPNLGGMQVSQEQLDAMIAQRLPQHLQEHIQGMQTKHLVDSFTNKMDAAESRHPGLAAKLSDIEDYRGIAPVIEMANNMENTADIMAELMEHPSKMGSILALNQAGQRKSAMKMMQDLSNSIKVNTTAMAQEKEAQDPMAQLKSSASTGMDSNNLSVKDLQKMLSGRR